MCSGEQIKIRKEEGAREGGREGERKKEVKLCVMHCQYKYKSKGVPVLMKH
jgi:hypothetical protein